MILVIVFVYFWIGISPLAEPGMEVSSSGSNLLNQAIVVLMVGVVLTQVLRHPGARALVAPGWHLVLILFWFSAVSVFATSPEIAFRRLVYAALVCFAAQAALLLPRNSAEFARVIVFAMASVLGLAYFTVLVMPHVGIHQATDLVEATLAGSWRGHFGHKNVAAAAMGFIVLFGLYLRQADHPKSGNLLIILAAIFLVFAGGKTATGMLPAVLVLAWMFERWRWIRYPLVIGMLLVLNGALIGSAVDPAIGELLASLGIDATFTGRSSIWAFALGAIADHPLTGYGFQSFWQTGELAPVGKDSWVTIAAHSHNSFLEALINAGVPGLVLIVIWLVILPIRNAGQAFRAGNDPALTRLFLRIWLFSTLLASLESAFFVNTGPIWFTMLIGVFGLRFQATASLNDVKSPTGPRTLAHA